MNKSPENAAHKDAWNPDQYHKFKTERSQPFFDLAKMISENLEGKSILDLGCGSGELTALLPSLTKANHVVGIDNSEKMLAKALALENENIKFHLSEIYDFSKFGKFDVLFSNAALQWCTGHPKLFAEFKQSLNPGGQIAFQMPMNYDYPTHILSARMSKEPHWNKLLQGESYEKSQHILNPEEYAVLLFKVGFKKQQVLQRVYGHVMTSREDVVEWVRGSMMTFFQSRLSPANFESFLEEYKDRLFKEIPDERPFFYPFKRIFLWAQL